MLFGAIVVLVVLLGGYIVASPYITLMDIKIRMQDHSQENMAKIINFPVLRENFRQQLSEYLIKSNAVNMHDDNPYAGVEVFGLTKKMADDLILALISPAGLTNLISGQKLLQDGIAVNQQTTENSEIFKAARYSYDNINSFSARVKDDHDEDVRFVLTRNGLSWKLTNIVFPLQCDACHENRSNEGKRE